MGGLFVTDNIPKKCGIPHQCLPVRPFLTWCAEGGLPHHMPTLPDTYAPDGINRDD